MFPLEIFPERGLAESVITTVWVGVWVISYFNLRFGWPFSGLVVPGYIVPLMIAKPASAAVVCIEGFITYLIVRYACERFTRSGSWSSFFGRDRFFALIVASLLVRLVLDGWILPAVGEFVNQRFDMRFDYRNNLSSFGLIIVALIGNQFWKTGLLRGQVPFWVTTGLTYVAIRYGLMEFTNFNIGNLEYMYENISSSLVASPKAYIVLLTTAFVASRMNLQYGWDFNGILIPSLLALEWYQPSKVFTTFLESLVILVLAARVLRWPCFRQTTMEGARKLLLFFNVSFAYKMVLGHAQQIFQTEAQLTDFYGYGYLVPTLIAVKMHDKHIPLRLTRATLQASLAGAAIAGVLGFFLTLIPPLGAPEAVAAVRRDAGAETRPASLARAVREDKLALYEKRGDLKMPVPLPQEVGHFLRALRHIDRHARTGDPERLRMARAELGAIGYEALRVDERWLYLRESGDLRGWGLYIVNLERTDGLVIEVPAPVEEWAVLEAGTFLLETFDGRALAAAGAPRRLNRDGSSDVLRSGRTLYSVFHRTIGQRQVLQVRGYDDQTLAELSVERGHRPLAEGETPPSMLWVKRRIPEGLRLGGLQEIIGAYRLEWARTRFPNLQREDTRGAFGELLLSRRERKRLLSRSVLDEVRGGRGARVVERDVDLRAWLHRREEDLLPRGSEEYAPPAIEELLFLDEEVLTPFVELWLDLRRRGKAPGPKDLEQLEVIASSAALFDLEVGVLRDADSGSSVLVLSERDDATDSRGWGTYVLRLGSGAPFAVEVPRPGLERYVWEYGVHLFWRLRADALLLAGAHPGANASGLADVTREDGHGDVFTLAHQVVLRELRGRPMLALQARAFGLRDPRFAAEKDVLVAFGDGCTQELCKTDLDRRVLEALREDGTTFRLVDGSRETAGYEAYGTLQSHYARLDPEHGFTALWLSPFYRAAFRGHEEDSYRDELFDAAGVPTVVADLHDRLAGLDVPAPRLPWPPEAVEPVRRFVESGDVVLLRELASGDRYPRLERLVDRSSRRTFLLVWRREDRLPVVFRLRGKDGTRRALRISPAHFGPDAVARFRRSLFSRLGVVAEP